MALLLGIDTGGTYTDAVLMDQSAPAPGIVAKAKALTTHHDLAIGKGLPFVPRGRVAMKGFPDPITIYAVDCTGTATAP